MAAERETDLPPIRTKIVATIGPASRSRAVLRRLIEAGATVFRLNFSHGTHEEHAEVIARIREGEARWGRPIAILQDLQGPKIRLGTFGPGGGGPFVVPESRDGARSWGGGSRPGLAPPCTSCPLGGRQVYCITLPDDWN